MDAQLAPAVDALEDALRRARGRNLYRGRTHWQPAQRRWILEAEPRGTATPAAAVVIQLQADGFHYQLEGVKHRAGLTDDLDAFLVPLLAALRGQKPHIHTYMHRTEYKPGFQNP